MVCPAFIILCPLAISRIDDLILQTRVLARLRSSGRLVEDFNGLFSKVTADGQDNSFHLYIPFS